MRNILILVTDRCQASSIHMVLDLLISANYASRNYFGSDEAPFKFELVGLKRKEKAYNQASIENIQSIHHIDTPDIVIIPGAFEAIIDDEAAKRHLHKYKSVMKALRAWHDQGAILASACTGNFLLANAGLAKGREITCHWASSSLAGRLFPDESFCTDKLLIDHGDIISAGGASAIAQLVLYLLAREHSRELALITAKMMLVEINFEQQSRFAIFRPSHDHGDSTVLKLQRQLEDRFFDHFDIQAFSSKNGLSEKQLVRRFKKNTSETPLSYLQKIRVEKVKIALESGAKSLDKTIWDTGYEDITSFRRLFKKLTGLTMKEYRSRFSTRGI